jgi:hypothetical protein
MAGGAMMGGTIQGGAMTGGAMMGGTGMTATMVITAHGAMMRITDRNLQTLHNAPPGAWPARVE